MVPSLIDLRTQFTILLSALEKADCSEDKAFIVAMPFTLSTKDDCLSASITAISLRLV